MPFQLAQPLNHRARGGVSQSQGDAAGLSLVVAVLHAATLSGRSAAATPSPRPLMPLGVSEHRDFVFDEIKCRLATSHFEKTWLAELWLT
ncbi:hypothetical protein GCM10018954_044890 [Kutzneria kofuensis]